MVKHFKVVVEKEPQTGGFSAFVPCLPGCASQGETEEETLTNIKEAIELYLSSLQEDQIPLPATDVDLLIRDVEVVV